MTEYIEAKDLDNFRNDIMDEFLSLCNYNDYNKITLLRIGETIDEIYDKYCSKPLADVVEMRHGYWMHEPPYKTMRGDYLKGSECSVCHNYFISNGNEPYSDHPYCCQCGAKMDGKPPERSDAE